MAEVTQVFVVTSGAYSDYQIESVWLTREEAELHCASTFGGQVEVWPIGDGPRTVGTFQRLATLDDKTGATIRESVADHADIEYRPRVWITGDADTYTVNVTADTRERCDKVFGEVVAEVRALISMGMPAEVVMRPTLASLSGS